VLVNDPYGIDIHTDSDNKSDAHYELQDVVNGVIADYGLAFVLRVLGIYCDDQRGFAKPEDKHWLNATRAFQRLAQSLPVGFGIPAEEEA
jgi:hypothetical protein